MPGLEPVAHTAPRSPLSVEEDNDDDMPALEAVEEAAAQRPQHAAPVPGATSPAANMSERDRLLDVLAGIGGLFGGGNDTGPDAAAARARQARQARRSVSVRNRALPSIPQTRPQRERLGALGGVRSSGGRTSTPEGGVNWWSMYRFAPVVVSPVNPANINVNATATTGPSGPAANTPILPANVAPSSTPSAQANGTAPLPSLADAHVVFPVIIVGIQSIENIFGLGGENAPPPAPPASADRQARDDERTPLLDAQEDREEDDAAESPSDDPSRAPWRSRAADAVRRTIRRARGTTGEGAGDAQTDTDGARPTEAPSSRTFAMYVIGAYYPPTHALLTSPPPPTFDALLELADLANLGNLGAIGLAMGGLGSRAATVSKEQIEKSELTVVKAKDLVVWTPKEGEKEPEVDTAVTAVRDSCIERCLICLDSYEAEDEVRVMSCRHAFHKNCVDTWMETGKNNCPFCRGKGVDTNSQPAAAATAAAA
ncbi:hypothetical protein BD626DRAFT_227586 [Schizophyllum amplum]|uniref:RING-type domain-containing protein n=1 Tax=Schizophyllum amplum TaxID=97359 RepID=A0A550BWL9_9AGAR|nr:hypothetical protein BD626DRAFT_227586 [Auriculariopsis ampla]